MELCEYAAPPDIDRAKWVAVAAAALQEVGIAANPVSDRPISLEYPVADVESALKAINVVRVHLGLPEFPDVATWKAYSEWSKRNPR